MFVVFMLSGMPSASAQDADADGIPDADEAMTHMTNPMSADTDGDGLTDGDELLRLGTNPLLKDSDGGGVEDWAELLLGTDPTLMADDDATAAPTSTGAAMSWVRASAAFSTLALARQTLSAQDASGSFSFSWDGALNFSNQPSPHGPFGGHTEIPLIWGADLSQYSATTSGWLWVAPATAANPSNTYTFAASTDEGFSLSVFDGATIKSVELDGARAIATGPLLVVDFPDTGGLFPIELIHWDSDAVAGAKLSWAPGDQMTFNEANFSLITGAQIAAPKLSATQRVVDVNAGVVEPGDTLEVIVEITNTGMARTDEVEFRPATLSGAAFSQYTVSPAGAQPKANSTSTLVLPFIDRGATVQLRYNVVVAPGVGVTLQGELLARVFPISMGGQGGLLRVLTDDPTISGELTDRANAPQGLFGATARTDDDANQYALSQDITLPPLSVDSPTQNSTIFNSAPSIYGFSEPGATITLTLDINAAVTIAADVTGAWHYNSPSLMPGAHQVTVEVQDAAGNAGASTIVRDFTVGAGAFPLSLDFPYPNQHINTAQLTYTGNTVANAAVALISYNSMGLVDDTGAVNTGAGTTYNYTTPVTLMGGAQTVEITATRGAVSAKLIMPFIVDVFPAAVIFTSPMALATVGQSQPTIRGTTDPFARVDVQIDQVDVGFVRADGQGRWQFTPMTALADGQHILRARATDVAGNVGLFFNLAFSVDTMAPPIALTAPAPNTVTRQRQPTITGTTEPNAKVKLQLDGGPTIIVTADGQGRWSHTPQMPLAEGAHTIVAIACDDFGNESAPLMSGFTIDATAPMVEILTPTDGQLTGSTPMITGTTDPGATLNLRIDGGAAIVVTVNVQGAWAHMVSMPLGDGPHRALATASDAALNSATDQVDFIVDSTPPMVSIETPQDGEVLTTSTPTITGKSEPGLIVTVFINDVEVGQATADANGDWSLSISEQLPLMAGTTRIRATASDELGNSASDLINVTIELPDTLSITSPAEMMSLRPDFTIEGDATPGQMVEVFIDDIKVGDAIADANGKWSLDVTGVAAGRRELQAKTAQQMSNKVNVLIIVAGQITITTPKDGDMVSDDTPLIEGTAPAGESVTVIINGQVAGMTSANSAGQWSFQVGDDSRLVSGQNTIEATSTDDTGDTITTGTITVTYDTTSWSVVITSPSANTEISATPTISGKAAPNAQVEVFVDGKSVGTTQADANGDWSLTVSADKAITPGTHAINARATLGEVTRGSADVVVSVISNAATGYLIAGGPGCTQAPTPHPPLGWGLGLLGLLFGFARPKLKRKNLM